VPDILERQLHYAAEDSDNFLDAAQNALLIRRQAVQTIACNTSSPREFQSEI
jgi:hypothetical protein